MNSNKRSCRWGNRHAADMHREPAFLLVPEFPPADCRPGGALVVLLVLLCSSLGSDGPLGSSCFCAGLKQKPCVSSSSSKRDIKVLWREWKQQWSKGRNCAHIRGLFSTYSLFFHLCTSLPAPPILYSLYPMLSNALLLLQPDFLSQLAMDNSFGTGRWNCGFHLFSL